MPCFAMLCESIPCFRRKSCCSRFVVVLCVYVLGYALLHKEYARDHPGVTVLEESFFDDVIRFASQLCLAH